MKCYTHTDREAVALCTACGKPICNECHISVDDKANCFNCIKKEMDQEVQETSKKNVFLTMILSFFPLFPLGFNFLYLGRPIKGMVFLAINLILLAIFWPLQFFLPHPWHFDIFMNIYLFVTIILRFVTHFVCLAIINKTHKIHTLGRQLFAFSILMVSFTGFFVLSLIGLVSFPGVFQDSFDYWEIPVTLVIAGFFWAFAIGSRYKKKAKKIPQFELAQIEELAAQVEKQETDEGNAALQSLYSDLKKHAHNFKNTTIHSQVNELSETTNKIIQFVEKYPHKSRNINKFVDYYLPTTNKLLENYQHLKDQGRSRSGTNINKATEKIEELLVVLQKAYNNQLDSLFEDKALDIDAEVSVLKSILEKEGLLTESEKTESEKAE